MEHRLEYQNAFKKIHSLSDQFKMNVESRLNEKFETFKKEMPVDKPRFMQEVLYYLEKMDIHEELNRIQYHLDKLDKIFDLEGEKGRQFEFLSQF